MKVENYLEYNPATPERRAYVEGFNKAKLLVAKLLGEYGLSVYSSEDSAATIIHNLIKEFDNL